MWHGLLVGKVWVRGRALGEEARVRGSDLGQKVRVWGRKYPKMIPNMRLNYQNSNQNNQNINKNLIQIFHRDNK